jgi:hypothetical protein
MAGEVTLAQFKVMLDEFGEAIDVVAKQSARVHDILVGIGQSFRHVTDLWNSPASQTVEPLRVEYLASSDDLDDVLNGIVDRMRITYQNYVDMERKAVQNLTAHKEGDHGGGSGGGGDKHNHVRTSDTRHADRMELRSDESVRPAEAAQLALRSEAAQRDLLPEAPTVAMTARMTAALQPVEGVPLLPTLGDS